MTPEDKAEYQMISGWVAAGCFLVAIVLAILVHGWVGIGLAVVLGILGFVFMYECGRRLD